MAFEIIKIIIIEYNTYFKFLYGNKSTVIFINIFFFLFINSIAPIIIYSLINAKINIITTSYSKWNILIIVTMILQIIMHSINIQEEQYINKRKFVQWILLKIIILLKMI